MSKRSYFGTDGIRGQANKHPMTAEVALRVGLAAGKLFLRDPDRRHLVVIGKDTRLSGYMIEPALVAGFASVGMDVRLFGPLPTPAVAMMTRSMRADLGVMISASHNTYSDNGIKLFGPDGYKLSDAREAEIEALMDEGLQEGLAAPGGLGRVQRIDDAQARYVEIVKATFPRSLTLNGLRVVIDCANGAAYKVAPHRALRAGRRGDPGGGRPHRDQHQRRLRLDLSEGDGQGGAGVPRRHRHRPGRRRRPGGDLRRARPGGRRRPDHGRHRQRLGRGRTAFRWRGWWPRSCPTWGWSATWPSAS